MEWLSCEQDQSLTSQFYHGAAVQVCSSLGSPLIPPRYTQVHTSFRTAIKHTYEKVDVAIDVQCFIN